MQERLTWGFVALLGAALMAVAGYAALPGGLDLPSKPGWLAFSVGSGLMVLALCWAGGSPRFGALALAFMAGNAGELALTDPLYFPAIRADGLSGLAGLAVVLVGLQAATTLWVFWPERRAVWAQAVGFGVVQIGVVAGLLALFSASIMGYLPHGNWSGYAKQIIMGGAVVGLNLLTLAALARSPAPRLLKKIPRLPVLVVTAVVASLALAWLAIQFAPHVEDEVAYLFHARLFADGRLWAPPPPEGLIAGLEYYLLTITDGRWFAVTTPGWPAVLTIAEILGAPWLMNPVLAGLTLVLMFLALQRVADDMVAWIAAFLLASSAWFLSSAATLMPHIASSFFTALAWWLVSRRDLNLWSVLLAGAAMGAVFTIRQLEGVLVGGVTGVAILVMAGSGRRLAPAAIYAVGCAATGLLYFGYNAVMTGNALVAPLEIYLDALWHPGANAYGFGPDIGPVDRWGALDYAPGHSLTEGLVYAFHNLFYTNFELFGWSIGSLCLVLAHLVWGRKTRLDAVAWAIIVVTILAHVGYWFSGSFYIGPRYWSAALLPLVYLSARGVVALANRAGVQPDALVPVLWVLALTALLVFLPWRGAERFHEYGGYDGEFARAAAGGRFGASAVIYQGERNPGVALILNEPMLPADKPVYLDGAHITQPVATDRPVVMWPAP